MTTTTTKPLPKPHLSIYPADSHEFVIPSHYKLVKKIGQGAYGIVWAALDTKTGKKVAIKKNFNVMDQDREYQKRILRELKILRHFKGHENVIGLVDIFPPKNYEEFNDVYMVMDLMPGDLRAIIKSDQIFSDNDIKFFMYHLLKGMRYLHSGNVIHRDIKPSNLLIDEDMKIKLCDFGLSRAIDIDAPQNVSTLYVVTRWYRAPELITQYGGAGFISDMWAIGCVFAELLEVVGKRKPILPGDNYIDQLTRIVQLTGTPSDESVFGSDAAKQFIKSKLQGIPKTDLKVKYKHANPLAVDLLEKMLEFNPHKRISADDALKHPYLKDMYDDEEMQKCPAPFTFNLEDSVPVSQIKKLLYDEIMDYNREFNKVDGDAIIDN